MYLCGHPGTGKTSSLNSFLANMRKNSELKFEPLLYNAMTYSDVKSFSLVLHEELHEKFFGVPPKRLIQRS
jgi:predicted NACHT family NTPase